MDKKLFSRPARFLAASALALILALILTFINEVRFFPSSFFISEDQQPDSFGGNLFFGLSPKDGAVPVGASGDQRISGSRVDAELTFFGRPVKNVTLDVLSETEIVPCGITTGIIIETTGLMVLGSGVVPSRDGAGSKPCEGKVKPGDIILKVDNIEIENEPQFSAYLHALEPGAAVTLDVSRDGRLFTVAVDCAVSSKDGMNKLGLYVRDSTKGIGTITYYSPDNFRFGALGHGIMDVDTKRLIPVKTGKMYETDIVGIVKGKKGAPGELVGEVYKQTSIGVITENTDVGLFGTIDSEYDKLPDTAVGVVPQTKVHEGPAVLISNVSGLDVKRYDVYIERVNRFSQDESKGMIIRITDQELKTKTNGIVQGMSGCPIIQDGALIGALTHVFVQNPDKGYGIFIENMLKR